VTEPPGIAFTRLATAALERWGVKHGAPCLIKRRENAVFEVRTAEGAPAVLRIHRRGYHSDADLRSELLWMAHLSRSGLPVPHPIPDRRDRLLIELGAEAGPDVWRIDMLSWMTGRPLGETGVPLGMAPAELARVFHSLGAVAARMHAASDDWHRPAEFSRCSWDLDGLLGESPVWGRFWDLEALDGDQRRLIGHAREAACRDLRRFADAGGDFGLIHADLVRENVLVAEDGVQLIDFDDSGFGWRMFEIATALHRNRGEPHYALIECSLVSGYRSMRPLPDHELERLPLFMLLRSLTYLGWIRTRRDEPGSSLRLRRFIAQAVADARAYLDGSA
jgi:Ser/Thr protein kinase RdoA (MazF antagonist)